MNDFKEMIEDILFPTNFKCVVCGTEIDNDEFLICKDCLRTLPYINSKVCEICGDIIKSESKLCLNCKKELPFFNKGRSLFEYEQPISGLIKNLKYDNARYLRNTLSAFILKCYLKNEINADVVIPVPLHYLRQKERGYNQSEELCYHLKHTLNLNVNTFALVRTRNTSTQTGLDRKGRMENLESAFKVVDKSAVKEKVVLLVDDVFTTGSTLNECAKVLKKAGAKQVLAITLARAVLEC